MGNGPEAVLGFDVRDGGRIGTGRPSPARTGHRRPDPPTDAEIDRRPRAADLVVVENLCSLPLNAPAAAAVARVLRSPAGRAPPPRPALAAGALRRLSPAPRRPRAWVHVTVNELSRRQLAERGIRATVVRNAFDVDPPPATVEARAGSSVMAHGERLLLQPTRAIPRKNVAGGLALAAGIGATYWLLGPAEDGYGPELDACWPGPGIPVIHGR
jgi:hypothetical protein